MNFSVKYLNNLERIFRLRYFGIFVISFFLFVSIISENYAYAERSITYKKTLDVKKETIENMLYDANNYSKLLSSETKLLDVIGKEDSKEVNILIDVGACIIQTGLQHSAKNNLHVINFVSGSLKGSILDISLQETWSFDGTENEGTIVTINFTIQDIPCVPDFLIGDKVLEFALDKSLVKLEHKAKEIQKELNDSNNHAMKPSEKTQNINSQNENNIVKENTETNSLEENVRILSYNIAMEDDPQKQLKLLEKVKNLKELPREEKTKDNSELKLSEDETKQYLENNDQNKVNSIDEDISSMLTINSKKFEIEKYKPKWLVVSGIIDEPKRGNTVLLTITKPDETNQILKIFHTKDGYYQTRLSLDNSYPDGIYSINAVYGNNESSVFFQIQSKHFS